MGLIVRIMGWAPTMAGMAVTVIMIPSSTIVGRLLGASRKEMLKHTDARVKLSTEIVTGEDCEARKCEYPKSLS